MRRLFLLAVAGVAALTLPLHAQQPANPIPERSPKPEGAEVAVVIRTLSVPMAAMEKFIALTWKDNLAFLDEAQFKTLMLGVASDNRVQLQQAPKLTVASGQHGSVQIVDHQFFLTGVQLSSANGQTFFTPDNKPYEIGDRYNVSPTVSADRKSVGLDLHFKRTNLASSNVPLIPVQIPVPQVMEGPGNATTQLGQPTIFQMFFQQPQFTTMELKQQFNMPVGRTALIVAGQEKRETRTEVATPIVGKIPYLGRLFRNMAYGQESCMTILLVTPQLVTTNETREVSYTAPGGN